MTTEAYELAYNAGPILEEEILIGRLLTRAGQWITTLDEYVRAVEAGEKPIAKCNLNLLRLIHQGNRSYEALAIATGWTVEACEERACWLAALGYLRVVPGAVLRLWLTEAGAGWIGQ